MAKFFWEENSSTVEVIEEVTIAVGAAQVNSDFSSVQRCFLGLFDSPTGQESFQQYCTCIHGL